jgi:hypothetical protein
MTNCLSARAPKYHRVADVLRREIRDGDLAPDSDSRPRPPCEGGAVDTSSGLRTRANGASGAG